MIDINLIKWEKFLLCDIFDVRNTHSIMKKEIEENSGIFPYVTASEASNSVVSYISYDMEQIEKGNSILIGGKTSVISYQPKDYFSNDSHNLALYLKENNKRTENIQLFLVAVIKASLSPIYTWGDSISKKTIQKDVIYLPVNSNETPDWSYMDSFIKSLSVNVENVLSKLKTVENSTSLIMDSADWRDFHIYDIFDINSGTKLDKGKMKTTTPLINFVGRSNFNNGITEIVNEIDGIVPFESGNLTLALGGAYLGSCFLQSAPFYTSQNVVVLIPKADISWEAKQFIATTIFKESQNNYRAFVKELNAHIKRDFTIKLPSTPQGTPDFEYMTNFMKHIQEQSDKTLSNLKRIL